MDAKFTPGPWRVDGTVALGAYGVWTDYGTHPGDVAGELYPDQVCSVYCNNKSHFDRETRDANAKLIAAAPELYEALRDAQSALAMLVDANTTTQHAYAHVKLAESKARAALAKAV